MTISERKLRANRANAKRSTGPKTSAGKAASCRNALKHGILSCSVDLSRATPADASLRRFNLSIVPGILGTDSAQQEISRIRDRMIRVIALEKDCTQLEGGFERNARLICRYERMLTNQLHARIRECAGLAEKE